MEGQVVNHCCETVPLISSQMFMSISSQMSASTPDCLSLEERGGRQGSQRICGSKRLEHFELISTVSTQLHTIILCQYDQKNSNRQTQLSSTHFGIQGCVNGNLISNSTELFIIQACIGIRANLLSYIYTSTLVQHVNILSGKFWRAYYYFIHRLAHMCYFVRVDYGIHNTHMKETMHVAKVLKAQQEHT